MPTIRCQELVVVVVAFNSRNQTCVRIVTLHNYLHDNFPIQTRWERIQGGVDPMGLPNMPNLNALIRVAHLMHPISVSVRFNNSFCC